jgi:hypothetical protein
MRTDKCINKERHSKMQWMPIPALIKMVSMMKKINVQNQAMVWQNIMDVDP